MTAAWLWLAAAPALTALVLWAITDLHRFVYIAIPAAMVFPSALIQPGGAIVALADLLILGALGAWIVVNAVRGEPAPRLKGNPMLLPTLIFAGLTAASLAWSDDVGATLKVSVQIIEIVFVLPLLFASVPPRASTISTGFTVFAGVAMVLSLITLASLATRIGGGSLERLELPGGLNKNATGSFIAAGLVLSYVSALTEARVGRRRLAVAASGLMLAATVATFSRGSVLGALVAMAVASVVLRRHRVVTLLLVGVVTIGYLLVIGADSRVDPTTLRPGSYDSSTVRVYSFDDAIDKIKDRPLLGSGAGTYEVFIPQLQITLPDPNNMFLLTWAELGIVGIAALLFLLGRYARVLVRSRRLPPQGAALSVAAGCVSLSLFVHFQVDVTWTRGTASLAFAMIGAMVAAQRLSRSDATGQRELGASATDRIAGTRRAVLA